MISYCLQLPSEKVYKKQVSKYAKIPIKMQFFEASGPRGFFFEINQKKFSDVLFGNVWNKFQIHIVFGLVREWDTWDRDQQKYEQI